MRQQLFSVHVSYSFLLVQKINKTFRSAQNLKRNLWRFLVYTCILYNFHRYIFKYSHGGYPKEGYQQTPLGWQMGKFIIVGIILGLIYFNSKFDKKIKKSIIIFYFFILIIFIINILSGVFYHSLSTDEIEYCLYAFMLLPMSILSKSDLEISAHEFFKSLRGCQLILFIANAFVIYNYYVNKTLPFHAYEGVLLRFGGFWDDPNTLAIFSVFLFGYSVINRQYVYAALNVVNVLLAISFSGYILLIAVMLYVFVKSRTGRITKIIVAVSFSSILLLFLTYNLNLILAIYEAKKQSVSEHATLNLKFGALPLMNSIQFHETWYISSAINYFPFSIIMNIGILYVFFRAIISEVMSLQSMMIVIFFVSNFFLPFLYMFPVNFIAMVLLILYIRKIYI